MHKTVIVLTLLAIVAQPSILGFNSASSFNQPRPSSSSSAFWNTEYSNGANSPPGEGSETSQANYYAQSDQASSLSKLQDQQNTKNQGQGSQILSFDAYFKLNY